MNGSDDMVPAPVTYPGVSVISPILNEERHLRDAVANILASDYPGPIEIVLALGPSDDATDAVATALADADDRVRLVGNPSGKTAAGLNAAVAQARYSIIARVDGHALIPPTYLSTAVATLNATGAANVGGVMAAEGETDFEKAVAAAMRSWFGVGGAAFHIGGEPGPALTVYLGVFQRTAIEAAGGFDESMVRAQDWELNHRIRAAGGLIWFTPDLQVSYRPRAGVRALASQYWQYGRWRREVTRRHPETVSARYLAPPAVVTAIAAGTALAIVSSWSRKSVLTAVSMLPALGYAGGVAAASAYIGRGATPAVKWRIPIALITMHTCWGAGFIRGA